MAERVKDLLGGMAIIIEWSLLAVSLAMVTLPAVYLKWHWLALPFLVVFFILVLLRARSELLRSKLLWPWLVFIASAAWGMWISIAPDLAQIQFVRILVAFAVFCAVIAAGGRQMPYSGMWLAWITVVGTGLLAVYWPLKHQFAGDPGKFSLISRIGSAINSVAPALPGPEIFSNVAGGVFALAIPFGAALAWWGWREGKTLHTVLTAASSLACLGALVLTSSRGAMLGLFAAGVLFILGWIQYRLLPHMPAKAVYWGVIALSALLLVGGLASTGSLERLVGSVPDPTGTMQSRMGIWRSGLPLVMDYFFTGAGLSTFPIVYSVYTLLIHVPLHEHLHNIFLETWYEQGIFGLIAILWGMMVLAGWVWRGLTPPAAREPGSNHRGSPASAVTLLGWAAVAALVAMGVHGMVDVVFYIKRSMPLVGLVLGFASLLDPGLREQASGQTMPAGTLTARLRLPALLAGCGFILLLGVLFYRQLLGLWYANLGALAQTRQELSVYDSQRFAELSLDAIRNASSGVDLSQVEDSFNRALEHQPANRTALQRLASLALSRGEYAAALAYTRQLIQTGRRDDITRMLYSDALVANGDLPGVLEEAANSVRGLPSSTGRLLFQAWYRYWLQDDPERARNALRTVLLLDPANQQANTLLERMGSPGSP